LSDAVTDAHVLENTASTNGERLFSGPGFIARVEQSLIRAAKQAHLESYLAGTGVVTTRDGLWGIYRPDPAMYEELLPPDFDRSQVPPQLENEETFPDVPTSLPQEFLDGLRASAKSSAKSS